MESNGHGLAEDVSLLDLDNKVKDLQTIKASLKREIDQNQMVALSLRESVKALSSKYEEVKHDYKKLEYSILERREELSSIESSMERERQKVRNQISDNEEVSKSLNEQMVTFTIERTNALKEIDLVRSMLAIKEKELAQKSTELDVKIKEANGSLGELTERREKIRVSELRVSKLEEDSIKIHKDAESKLREAEKVMSDAKGAEARYNSLVNEFKDKSAHFESLAEQVKLGMNDNEIKKAALIELERDLIIQKDSLEEIKRRLIKEIEIARIDSSKKESLKKEISK